MTISASIWMVLYVVAVMMYTAQATIQITGNTAVLGQDGTLVCSSPDIQSASVLSWAIPVPTMATISDGSAVTPGLTSKYTAVVDTALNQYRLIIHNVDWSDKKQYRCEVNFDSADTSLSIVDSRLPRITGTTAVLGQDGTLVCSSPDIISGAVLRWSIPVPLTIISEGSRVEPGLTSKYTAEVDTGQNQYRLTIHNVGWADQKIYRCDVNFYSVDTSLTVKAPPLDGYPQCNMSTTTVRENTAVTLYCRTAGGKPRSSLTWKNGTAVLSDTTTPTADIEHDRTAGYNTYTFTANRFSSGVYTCEDNQEVLPQPRTCQTSTLTVIYAPSTPVLSIQSPSPSSPIAVNTNVVLRCTSSDGNPTPTVQIAISGSSISGASGQGTVTYTRQISRTDNQKPFTCTANNAAIGTPLTSNSISLDVTFAPSGTSDITQTPSGAIQAGSQNIRLNCQTTSSSNPASVITWHSRTKDGSTSQVTQGITPSTETGVSDKGTISKSELQLTTPGKEYNGVTYTCRVTYSGQTPMDKSHVLNITYAPSTPVLSVQSPSPSSPIAVNTNVVLRCTSSDGNPTPTVQIAISGSSISGASGQGTVTYTRRISRTDNQKPFTCTANNAAIDTPLTSNSISLDVTFAPSGTSDVTQTPSGAIQAGSQNIRLNCQTTSSSNPASVITWYRTKDGSTSQVTQGITPSTETDVNDKGIISKSELQLTTPGKEYNGVMYTCRVTYSGQTPMDKSHVLNITYPAEIPNNRKPASPQIKKEGELLSVTCYAEGNPNIISYTWRKGNTDVTTIADITVSGGTMTISSLKKSDAGTYTCHATNNVGGAVTTDVLVNVTYAPDVTVAVMGNPQTITEGDPVTLQCNPDGNPPVYTDYRWTFDPVNQQGTRQVSTNKDLVFQHVTYLDYGDFTCGVSNSIGSGSGSKRLDVLYSPKVSSISNVTAAKLGDSASLSVLVTANPEVVTFKWKQFVNGSYEDVDDRAIISNPSSLNSTIRIPSVQVENYGQYQCTAMHQVRDQIFNFEIRARDHPEKPTDLDVVNATAVSLTVSWVSRFNGGTTQTFYIQYKDSNSQTWPQQDQHSTSDPGYMKLVILKIPDLNPETSYDIRVRSINKEPEDNDSGYTDAAVWSTDARPVFSKDESKLYVVINGEVATVSWSIESGQEDITSYKIKYCEKETSANCKEHTELNSTATSVDIMVEKGKDYTFTLYVYEGDDLILESQPFKQDPVTTPENSPSVGGIVGGIVGTVSALAVVAVVTVFVMRRRRTQEKKASDTEMAGRSSLVVGNDYNGAAGGVSNPALENGDVEEINPYAESPHVASTNNGRPAIAAKPVIAPKPTKGATGVEGLYAQPDKKKKQEKREPDPSALYAQPEKKKKGKVQDEELKNLYAQPDKNKKKKKIAEPKPSSYEDENPYQNVENQNDLGENPYANVDDERRVQEEEEEEQVEESTKNIGPDGTVYADLAFTRPKGKKPKDEIIRTEEATEYATIDFKRKPPPSD